MKKLHQVASLIAQLTKATDTSEKANALIKKWRGRDLGPNPLCTAIELEARNQVFGWGK